MEQKSKITILLQQLAEEWEDYQHKQHVEHKKLEIENSRLRDDLENERNKTDELIHGIGDLFDRLRGRN